MKSRRIIYLMSGVSHLPYLVVGLKELRNHWNGPVTVFAWPDSFPIVEQIEKDVDLDIEAVLRPAPARRDKNSQFLDKVRLFNELSTQSWEEDVLYLDADTMVVGDLDPLFALIADGCFAATQFCKWTTAGGIVQKRIARLLDVPGVDWEFLRLMLRNVGTVQYPSVNGGVFACSPASPVSARVLQQWLEWTELACQHGLFIADETVLHALLPIYVPGGFMRVAPPGYNVSPKFRGDIARSDVKIWHFHGDSNVRPSKSKEGFELWFPLFRQCWIHNTGRLQEWYRSGMNKWLEVYLDEKSFGGV